LQFASTFLEADPGFQTLRRVQQQIIGELQHCPWIILWKDRVQERMATIGPNVLPRYIRRHYRPVYTNTTYVVLARSRTAAP
jgi:hypothetical protein